MKKYYNKYITIILLMGLSVLAASHLVSNNISFQRTETPTIIKSINYQENLSKQENIEENSSQRALKDVNYLTITSNGIFASYAGIEGWNGNGSEINPYVIENYQLATILKASILIINTDVHFIIRNCNLSRGANAAIYLDNVTNGKISFNKITNSITGIIIESSYKIEFSNNDVENCSTGINLLNSEEIKIDNNDISESSIGIMVNSSQNNTMTNNTVINNKSEGIVLNNSPDNIITNNTMTNNGLIIHGKEIHDFLQLEIDNNKINGKPLIYWQNVRSGIITGEIGQIILINASNLELSYLIITNTTTCISVAYSSNISIHENSLKNIKIGIRLDFTYNITLFNNVFENNSWVGISLWNSNDIEITDNVITHSSRGIELINASNNRFLNNNITNTGMGLWLSRSNKSSIGNNLLYNCSTGIRFSFSEMNLVEENTLAECAYFGISLDYSRNNTVLSNTISNGGPGIYLSSVGLFGRNNRILYNKLFNTSLIIEGYSMDNEINDNLVNNKPLIFWENVTGNAVPPDAGQIILNNCTDVVVTGQNISHTYVALLVLNCQQLTIANNKFSNNSAGIELMQSTECYIVQNRLSSNGWGIRVYNSDNNIISNNTFTINILCDIWFMMWDRNNTITWNNFISSDYENYTPISAMENPFSIPNNYSYNFWDDWATLDENEDGYVDTPYIIYGYSNEGLVNISQDNYPLMSPVIPSIPKLLSPLPGETLKGTITINWVTGNDLFGIDALYSIYYSNDAGRSWELLSSDLSANYYDWDTKSVEDGSKYMIKIVYTFTEDIQVEFISDGTFTIKNTSKSNLFSDLLKVMDNIAIQGLLGLFIVGIFAWLGFALTQLPKFQKKLNNGVQQLIQQKNQMQEIITAIPENVGSEDFDREVARVHQSFSTTQKIFHETIQQIKPNWLPSFLRPTTEQLEKKYASIEQIYQNFQVKEKERIKEIMDK